MSNEKRKGFHAASVEKSPRLGSPATERSES